MAVLMSIGGNSTGDGFLVAPRNTTYDAEITLWTDVGTASVTLQASPNPAGLVFSQTAVNLSTAPTIVKVHSTLPSASRGDTTIQVLDGPDVVANFAVTSIKRPVVNFKGRFEARFATDSAMYNANPMYTANVDDLGPGVTSGWTWGLEGEPDFVPPVDNIPETLESPVGRVIRYNNPVSLRSHALPVTSTVTSITGETSSGFETFTTGDSLIGQPVDLGPNTYFAGNREPTVPASEETWSPIREPLALFELHLGNLFSGASQVGPFVSKGNINEHTRSPDSRPITNQNGKMIDATSELTEFGLPDLKTFSEARVDQLVADHNALPAGDSAERRNLVRRIGHLLFVVSNNKRDAIMDANPDVFRIRQGTLPSGWDGKEVFIGMVDTNLEFNSGSSSVVAYMSEFDLFRFESHKFAFHSDELCGYHKGTLAPHQISNGSYVGDPHTHTVDGTSYDLQSVGEFTLLRGNIMEIQARQTPVLTGKLLTDSYTGITACVSLITAVAARVGDHTISLQPARKVGMLQFFLDRKPHNFPQQEMDLGGHWVTTIDANGKTGLRVDYDDGTVFSATPHFSKKLKMWFINVSISHTRADEGIMGLIPKDSWLPRLRDGKSVGPLPANLHDRYVTLYKTFADSWRVTERTSLFFYYAGTSTKTFTDPEWPAEKPPCELKPELRVPGTSILRPISIERAEIICKGVTIDGLHRNCVFDVATTGDKTFANGYLQAQDLGLYGTKVEIAVRKAHSHPDRSLVETTHPRRISNEESLIVKATVSPLTPGRPTPAGYISFLLDDVQMSRPTKLDALGVAHITISQLRLGRHVIRATYSGGRKYRYHPSSSPSVFHTVAKRKISPHP